MKKRPREGDTLCTRTQNTLTQHAIRLQINPVKCYLQSSAKFVSKLCAPDRVSAFARSCGVACLNHEAFDVAVEQVVIIVSARTQCQKVLLNTK